MQINSQNCYVDKAIVFMYWLLGIQCNHNIYLGLDETQVCQ